MARKSNIERGPEAVRTTIDTLIRKGRFTLDEMRHYVAEKHGPQVVPSRSSLHRYSVQQETMLEKMRAIDAAARVVVEELGESPDDRAGALLVQSITTLATDAALRAQVDGEEPSIDDVRKLARAAKDVIGARQANLKERQQIERMARERLQREQSENLERIATEQGMDSAQVNFWRKQFLGVG
ncbi:phage protein Gp27 family protein [Pseudoxanthomonas sp. UTMC 1351]|uniref:phage protein Gp27 family protein n=1 Tax=Pseudoxanthomonas sp. UTMC 1351 TaxID=2695853 RepID=UPI0034CE4B45